MRITKKLTLVIALILSMLTVVACGNDKPPVINGATNTRIPVYSEFVPLLGVTAKDNKDGDITDSIKVTTNIDVTKADTYNVKYEVTNSAGLSATVNRSVEVYEEGYALAQYVNGVDLSKLDAEQKGILFAAAESYLLDNVYAGVPLYTGASRVMFSERVQLFSEDYNGVMGFGTAFSRFSADDSTVKMSGDTFGAAGEYTYRSSFNTDPTSLNPWIADDSNSSDFIDMFTGGLFDFFFDETKTGYEILPSLAASEPIPINPETINGKVYAKVWQIPVRNDLEWTFHPSTNLTSLPSGYAKLDANDYIWTWKTALESNWLRARTGGGDFVTNGVKGAAEFVNGTGTWENVGLRLASGTTNVLEIEYVVAKSTFELKYNFAGPVLSPICKELFEALGDNYGKGPSSVASSGIYYFDVWNPGQLLTFKKNAKHPQANMYNYTGYQYRYLENQDIIFQEFLAGRLESASIPPSLVSQYANDSRVRVNPDPTTWRLMINSFGTAENRDAFINEHKDIALNKTFVPEPILQFTEMRQALYYGFDRYEAAVNVVKTYLPAHTLFTSTYFLDAEGGVSVRGTDAGQGVSDNFGGESNGYFADAALDMFKVAVSKAIASGYYKKGTASSYTNITLELKYASSGSAAAQAMVANIKEQYETLLVDNVNYVRIIIDVEDVAFPDNYYVYMMPANCDLGIGGISGSLLDAPSFLDVFCDDNRGGFTLNWGIDTHNPRIDVEYTNLAGEVVQERWSYNALVMALVGKVYVKDGVELTAFDSVEQLITVNLDLIDEVLDSYEEANDLTEAVLGASLDELAEEHGFDSVGGYSVVTESGASILFVIGKSGNLYELISTHALMTDVEDAINGVIAGSGVTLLEYELLDTDDKVAEDEYIAEEFGWESLEEAAEALGVNVEDMLIYYIAYIYGGNEYSDAVVVLFIGGYYIPFEWL